MKDRSIIGNQKDKQNASNFLDLFKNSLVLENEMLDNLGLFIKRQSMSRIIFLYELYKKIIQTHGIIVEFGVRWGQDLALFESFRGMLEPFNYTRKIVGFDTFAGFPSLSSHDKSESTYVGDLGVVKDYEKYLEKLLEAHEDVSPINHIKKFELIKGDANSTFKKYLDIHPETIIAFAYFDFDLYEPTKYCLELCKDRFTRGSVIAFDELCHPDWPGETFAFNEVMGINKFQVERYPFMPTASFMVVD